MYLRESKQKRADGSLVTYLQLAENTWNPEKRRAETRILCNCGRADDEAVIERLRRLAKSILRRCSPEQIVAEGPEWRLVCAWPYGDVYALQALWERLGIGDILNAQAGARRVERALFAMVANRGCAPASKLYCYEQWLKEDAHIPGTEGLALQHLYRAMDFLEANKEAIEREIFFRVADLLSLDVEGVTISFGEDAIRAIARIAADVNTAVENIGARRLSTVMERLLDEISFSAPDRSGETIAIDEAYVTAHVGDIAKNADLSRYIL